MQAHLLQRRKERRGNNKYFWYSSIWISSASSALLHLYIESFWTAYSMALPMSSITFLASPKTIMVLSM